MPGVWTESAGEAIAAVAAAAVPAGAVLAEVVVVAGGSVVAADFPSPVAPAVEDEDVAIPLVAA
jgi:hypothetical protein